MTLHAEMSVVLSGPMGPKAHARKIAEEIKKRDRWHRPDGAALRAKQIWIRARKYPEMFRRVNGGVIELIAT